MCVHGARRGSACTESGGDEVVLFCDNTVFLTTTQTTLGRRNRAPPFFLCLKTRKSRMDKTDDAPTQVLKNQNRNFFFK